MRFWKLLVLTCFSTVLLAACSSNSESSKGGSKSSYDVASHEKMTTQSSFKPNSEAKQVSPKNQDLPSRKVIYNASLNMEVKNLLEIQDNIRNLVNQTGGYIVEERMSQDTKERLESFLTVRVPQEQFQSFLSKVKTLGIKVENQTISGQDVTEEYVDLQSRLKSKKLAEKRLMEFMNEAKDTKTLLEISNELSKVQEEIEALEGKIKYIDNQVDLSTVTIDLFENKVVVPGLDNNHLNTLEKTKKQFMKSINYLVSFLSWLVVFVIGNIPILILMGIICFIIFYIWKRKNKTSNDNTIEK